MKLVWHIIRKDLRRLWLPLVLWGAVIVAQYVVWRIDQWEWEAGVERDTFANAMLGLWGLHLLIAWLLVPQIIQDDPLYDDRAGWRTRPISGGRMLAAKVGGMALMLGLWPSLLTLPWWIEFGYGPMEIVRTLAVNMLGMAAFTGVALMVAVLVETFARFLLWSVVAVVAAGLGGLILASGMPADGEGAVNGSILLTRAALACGLVWAAAAMVVPLQFMTRSRRLARGTVAAAAILAVLVVQAWPWSGAQLLAKTGWTKFALPNVTARVAAATVVVPSDPLRQHTKVEIATGFSASGMASSDELWIRSTEPHWRMGDRHGTESAIGLGRDLRLTRAATALAQGISTVRDDAKELGWDLAFPGQIATQLRNGEAVIGAQNSGVLWRGERGPTVAVRAGAWAGRGLTHVHIGTVGNTTRRGWTYDYERAKREIQWVQTESLISPAVMLELINADGMVGRRFATALLMNGDKSILDYHPEGGTTSRRRYLEHGRIPVGLISVTRLSSLFERDYGSEARYEPDELAGEGATLTSVVFQEAAPLTPTLADTALVPDLVVEGRLDEALRRARAEEKLVLVRVMSRMADEVAAKEPTPWRYYAPKVRELMVSRFVCAQLTGPEAERLRKRVDDEGSSIVVILKPTGEEQDRLRDLYWVAMQAALEANLAGRTYAAVLMEQLAVSGGDDRQLRFQLHEALRARGELAGAFDAILWMAEHPTAPFEGTDVFTIGWRLERFVANYGPARTALLERRDLAVANLRRDPRDAGAARLLFTITLGLRRDEATWREFPRVIPRENPLWWEFTRNWINSSVATKAYRETARAVDLEKFFTEGPAWVRAQLMQKRAMAPNRPPATVGDWQRQLAKTGINCVEALAGTKQIDAAMRVVAAVRRIESSASTRLALAAALGRAGASAQSEALLKEHNL